MKLSILIKRASKNLKRSKTRTILTVLSIMVGSTTLVLASGLGSGVNESLSKSVSNTKASDALYVSKKMDQIDPDSSKISKYQPPEDKTKGSLKEFGLEIPIFTKNELETIKKYDEVDKIITPVTLRGYVEIEGINEKFAPGVESTYGSLSVTTEAGKFFENSNQDGVTIPKEFVDDTGIPAQDFINKILTITVLNQDETSTTKQYKIPIIGVTSSSFFGSNGSIYINENTAKEVNNLSIDNSKSSEVQTFVATPKEGVSLQTLKDKLTSSGYDAKTYEEANSGLEDVGKAVQYGLSVFAGIILFAAVFGIANTMYMSVYERTHEIGLMKALGMSNKNVYRMFAVEAAAIGFWGGIGGVVLGVGLGTFANTTFLGSNDFEFALVFKPISLILIVVSMMIISFVAGILPARRASKMDPIEALRN